MIAVMSVSGTALATGSYNPIANLTEKWNGGIANWRSLQSSDALQCVSNSASLSFQARSMTAGPAMDGSGDVFGDGSASGGRFTGDYVANGITDVTFDTQRNGLSTNAAFYFVSASGDVWYYNFTLPAVVGTWSKQSIPMSYSASWWAPDVTPSADLFNADKRAVVAIGVSSERYGVAAQSLLLDNLKLVGPWGQPFVNGISQAWLDENNMVGVTDPDKDHDGCDNLTEFLAGTDPNDPSSYFFVNISKNDSGETVLKWKHEPYRTFNVVATKDLTSVNGFSSIQGASGIQSQSPENSIVVDDKGDGLTFYKVEILQ